MDISSYNLDFHKHILSKWAASRAASQSKGFKFSVELGSKLLLFGKKRSQASDQEFIDYIKQIENFNSQDDYDSWHHQTIVNMTSYTDELKQLLDKHNKSFNNYTYGIAAKILNCYLKVFFLESFGNQKFADFIHPPVDAILLKALRKEDKKLFNFKNSVFTNIGVLKIPTWTRINENEYKEIIKLMKEFLSIKGQNGLWKIESFWIGHQ
tara:strand:+ start:877 stop:1506 length:630 start_codon:yes stop_codon:yes gene_type:complete